MPNTSGKAVVDLGQFSAKGDFFRSGTSASWIGGVSCMTVQLLADQEASDAIENAAKHARQKTELYDSNPDDEDYKDAAQAARAQLQELAEVVEVGKLWGGEAAIFDRATGEVKDISRYCDAICIFLQSCKVPSELSRGGLDCPSLASVDLCIVAPFGCTLQQRNEIYKYFFEFCELGVPNALSVVSWETAVACTVGDASENLVCVDIGHTNVRVVPFYSDGSGPDWQAVAETGWGASQLMTSGDRAELLARYIIAPRVVEDDGGALHYGHQRSLAAALMFALERLSSKDEALLADPLKPWNDEACVMLFGGGAKLELVRSLTRRMDVGKKALSELRNAILPLVFNRFELASKCKGKYDTENKDEFLLVNGAKMAMRSDVDQVQWFDPDSLQTARAEAEMAKESIMSIFAEFDGDVDRQMDRGDFISLLESIAPQLKGTDTNFLIESSGVYKDGKIDRNEFIKWVFNTS